MVAIELVDDLADWLKQQKSQDSVIVGLENNLSGAELARQLVAGTDRADATIEAWQNRDVVLVLGEEVNGIPTELREAMGFFLEFPMMGCKESFNVSVATGMALWELVRKSR